MWRLSSGVASALATAAFPERPVTLLVGYAPGGGSDIITRFVGKALAERWGQTVVVENRTGADGSIAAGVVARSAANGYTLIMVTNSHTMPPIGYALNYDPLKSFAPVSLADDKPMVLLVHPSLPVNSVRELIALARARPGELNYGTNGPATDPAYMTALLMQRTGIRMTNVSYKGGGQSQIAIISGEIQLVFGTVSAARELVKARKLKALAISTDTRSEALSGIPTIAEAANLPGYNESAWNGLLAPAGTPREIVAKISADVSVIMKNPEIRKTLAAQAIRTIGSTPEEFARFIGEEIDKHAAFFKTLEAK